MESKSNLFPKNLLFLRKSQGLSQNELANKFGLNRGNIASYESGSAEPNAINLLKIVKYFNIKLEYLLSKDIEKLENMSVVPYHKLAFQTVNEVDEVMKKSAEVLEIIRGKILYHQYRLDKIEDMDEHTLKSEQEILEIGDLASELASVNIKLCKRLKELQESH